MAKFSTGLGGNLLSDLSKAVPKNEFQVRHIPLEDIIPNDKNEKFSMSDIEELKQSIKDVGLQQNLVVMPVGDKYKLLTGHRRFQALTELLAEGDKRFLSVPCLVKQIADIDLNISDESKEIYLLATTNAENRHNTLAENIELMRMLNQVYDEIEQNGGRINRKEELARRLGVSVSVVRDLKRIDKNLSPIFESDIQNNELPYRAALAATKLTQEQQEQMADEKGIKSLNDVTPEEIETYAAELKQKATVAHGAKKQYFIDRTALNEMKLPKCIEQAVQNAVPLNKSNYESAKKIISNIEKQYKKLAKLLIEE